MDLALGFGWWGNVAWSPDGTRTLTAKQRAVLVWRAPLVQRTGAHNGLLVRGTQAARPR